jgi:hypothetical protein
MRDETTGRPWRYRGPGHVTLWNRLTIYGTETAMHGAVNVRTRWGYLCFKPPFVRSFGHRDWPWYLYMSRNATPWAATWGFGLRRFRWGFIRREVD